MNLPSLHIKKLAHNAKQFRLAMSVFLHSQSFYTLDEYFNQGNQENIQDSCCFVVTIYFIVYICLNIIIIFYFMYDNLLRGK